MLFCRAAIASVLVLAASPALGQLDDDLLAPLAPPAPKEKPPKPKKRRGRPEPRDEGPAQLLVKIAGGLRGARLYIDGREIGSLPGPAQTVSPGEHLIEVKRPGYTDFSRRVTLAPGKPFELSVALEANAGVLSVTADVPGAQIYLDGQLIGLAPQSELLVAPGAHEVVVRREGYKDDVQRITVRAGRDNVVAARLQPQVERITAVQVGDDRPERVDLVPDGSDSAEVPLETGVTASASGTPVYQRWYFWAGAAVVAAASVGAYVALSSPLTLEQVCGKGVPCECLNCR